MDIKYAVENAHDENILRHEQHKVEKESYLSLLFSLISLEPLDSSDVDEDTMRMHQQLLVHKADVDALDHNAVDYYEKKERIIFKIFCAFRGPVYEPGCDQGCTCECE